MLKSFIYFIEGGDTAPTVVDTNVHYFHAIEHTKWNSTLLPVPIVMEYKIVNGALPYITLVGCSIKCFRHFCTNTLQHNITLSLVAFWHLWLLHAWFVPFIFVYQPLFLPFFSYNQCLSPGKKYLTTATFHQMLYLMESWSWFRLVFLPLQ